MSGSNEQRSDFRQATSSGHSLAESAYLDRHFECLRTEFEAMLRSTNIQSGWRVLDAGAGGGSFLSLIDALVGSMGQVDALDLAPENV